MMNSVSFCGKPAGEYQASAPKKSNAKKGAMIGAGLGAASSLTRVALQRNTVKAMINSAVESGLTKNKAIASFAIGTAIGLALTTAVGSLLGGGVGKIVDHFKKPKAEPQEAKVDANA